MPSVYKFALDNNNLEHLFFYYLGSGLSSVISDFDEIALNSSEQS
jgi:hypothetical protein